MSRRALYLSGGLVLVPPLALGLALVTRYGLAWPFALAGSAVLGFLLRRPGREIAIVTALSAAVALVLAVAFFFLVWTGVVDSLLDGGQQRPAAVHDERLAADHLGLG
jgi:hypothetical protein